MTALWVRLESWANAPVPEWKVAWFRGIYTGFMILGVYAYGRGYDLTFRFLTKESTDPTWPVVPGPVYAWLRPLLYVLFALSILNRSGRLPAVLAWAVYSVYESQVNPYFRPYTNNLSFVVLGLIALAPQTRYTGRESVNGMSLRLSHLALAAAYLSACAAKLQLDGWRWFNGTRMTEILERNLLFTESAAAKWILAAPGAPIALGIAAIAFESLFLLSLFHRRACAALLGCGLLFHLMIFWILKINFFYFFVPVYFAPLIWLLPAKLNGGSKKQIYQHP